MKKRYFWIFFLVVPFIIPDYLFNFETISNIVKVWRLLIGAWVSLYVILRKKVNKTLLLITLFYLFIILSGLLHETFNITIFMDLSFLWIMYYLTQDTERQQETFSIIKNILFVFITINFVTMVFFPNGLYTTQYELNWFLGYKNGLIRKILPYLVLVLMNIKKKKIALIDKLGFIISIATILMSKSVTSIFGIIIFIVLGYLAIHNKVLNKIKIRHIFLLYIIADIILLYTNLFANITSYININTGRQTTMGARYLIWTASKYAISNSPIIGYGEINPSFYSMIPFEVSHPHNLLLHYLINGGIICILILLIGILEVDKHSNEKYEFNKIFAVYYITSFFMGLTESLIGAVFFIPFLIVKYNMNNNHIDMEEGNENNDRNSNTI